MGLAGSVSGVGAGWRGTVLVRHPLRGGANIPKDAALTPLFARGKWA